MFYEENSLKRNGLLHLYPYRKVWKIPLSYIGHCTGFSALKGSCTATAKRDVFQGVPQVVPDVSFWFGKEGFGTEIRYY